ncbi:cell envelope integrity protein TolA [Photobacterium lipolyticum]|uniref:Cell envelope integrity protein TolA n=1 Tax=Photobacterium lipolyticum TaxID=266810 RepID=A0A2T3N4M7_9GAMM|nr:cell envelope integrity protein TolA [Photobacterium lipolyticum]PSW07416.1 cell envelope integrity protein TolA [Photobacterium lipolyticum]
MKKNNYSMAVIISLCLHALLLAALLWGTDFSMNKPKIHGNTIKAVVVDPALVNQQAQKIRQQRNAAKQAEQDRLKRLEQQADSLEKQRKAEEQRLRELKADKLQAEKETRKAEADRKRVAAAKEKEEKQAAEEKRKADEATRVAKQQAAKAEADRKAKQEATRKAELARQKKVEEQRKAEEAARKAEEDRKAKVAAKKKADEEARKAEAAAKEAQRKAAEAKELQRQQEAALNDMFSGLEAENEQRGGARGQFASDEADRYGAIFKQQIQQNLLIDESFLGRECVVKMRLSVNGLVLDISDEGGDPNVCRAAKAAVVKVSQFNMPEDPLVIEKLRNIRLTVSPQ